MQRSVIIIGAGLAGSEAALYLAKRGFQIVLYDMKPHKKSNAHRLETYCELICNNSFCNLYKKQPLGLLFEELKILDSEIIKCIEKTRINDNKSIAVDRVDFSNIVTEKLSKNKNIVIKNEEIDVLPMDRPLILATGPLTSKNLLTSLQSKFDHLISTTDANSIVVDMDSINFEELKKISDDVYEINLNKSEYTRFENILKSATKVKERSYESNDVLQCLPVEELAVSEGLLANTKLYPREEHSYATIVLRRDDRLSNSAVLSGITTRLKHKEQERVLKSIRGLENVSIIKYGQLHYNTYINAPSFLSNWYEVNEDKELYVIGQLSGIDGYLPALSSAIVASIKIIMGKTNRLLPVPQNTLTGSLSNYVSSKTNSGYTTMIPLFEMLPNADDPIDDIFLSSKKSLREWISNLNIFAASTLFDS